MTNTSGKYKSLPHLTVSELCHSVSVGIVITPARYYVESGVRAFRSMNVRPDRISDERWVYLSDEGHRLHSKTTLRTGDVLIVRSGEPGVACVVTSEYDGCNCIDLVITRPNREKVLPQYLSYYLNSDIAKQSIQSVQGGLAQKHLNVSAVNKLRIPLPPLPEQQKIAAILSTWDRAIELTEKLVAAKQRLKQALFAKFFSKQQNSHSPKAKDEDRRVEIGKLVRKRFEKSCDLDKYPLHSFTIEDGVTQKTDRYERSFLLRDAENNGYSVVHFGDFVINPMNLRFGAIGRSQVRFPVTVSAYYDVFHIVDSNCDPIYLEYLLKSPFLMHTYERVSAGSLIEKKRVHFSEFGKIRIELPSLPEQKRISVILGVMDRELRLLTLKRKQLLQQKKGLMQQLLTGKVRVNVDTKAIKAAVT